MPKLQAAQIPVTPFQQNCALIWDAETLRGTVIDPGGEAPRLLAAIAKAGITVDNILLTHGHLDHAGGAEALRAALAASQGAPVPLLGPHRDDEFLLSGIAAQARQYGIEGLADAAPDRFLEEGEVVSIAGQPFGVLHCPGHAPGHVVFVSQALGFAVVGDVLFRGSIGRTDFPYGDHAALIHAIATKLLPLGDEMRFLCGHGPGSTFGAERKGNPFLKG
ncbi:MBL fold metallo-hydrolase [Falsiroseomonas selenitidurans]|uniref:MBL fold metallo-hydrolase n=1 Tax=Falsiroseomonas selenitidurans TaxID=2716335 RepID=A0ABX1E7P7_9PROT|nr:MBL fold metallo-hydrolase [Falsiroseomonas selenitidurans]NKC32988.1 MBL fold metallo-hydrolase [Falsiroseomonas selenitidurans]